MSLFIVAVLALTALSLVYILVLIGGVWAIGSSMMDDLEPQSELYRGLKALRERSKEP